MPSLVTHLLIPPLVLLATRRFPPRLVLLLLPLSLLPDIDFFVPPHRALLHSVFVVGLVAAAGWHAQRSGREPLADAMWIGAFYLVSHSLMDLFVGGVVPFWPLTDQTFFIDVAILIDTRTLQPTPIFEPGTQAGIPQVSDTYLFLDPVEFGVLVLTLATFGTLAVRRALRVKREVVVVSR